MTRTLTLLTAVFALAGSAALAAPAETGVAVSLAGKSAETIHRDIVRAARHVCNAQGSGSPLFDRFNASCVRDAVQRAETTLRAQAPQEMAAK